jgi:pyruvate/2-oxoglutarate dehydrogenase complex dihydrolipoamide acyltransferase (E2) component
VTDVVFPPLSKDEPDIVGVLSRWFVREGEEVEADQVLADVQVDKVSAEVMAPVAGRVHLVVPEETEVSQGGLIATIV